MRVLFFYCDRFAWTPALRTLEDAPTAAPGEFEKSVVAFVHVEPRDLADDSGAETKLVKHAKWLARKWETRSVVLHSFTHLADAKADPAPARELLERASVRLQDTAYLTEQTPYGYFLDLELTAPGHPLARIFKEF